MRRFMVRRVAHCSGGHGMVLDMTENCPQIFVYSKDLPDDGSLGDESNDVHPLASRAQRQPTS